MIYFTDGILIPGDSKSSQARDLSYALNGTGMIKCAQVGVQPDLVVDFDRSTTDEGYLSEIDSKVTQLMNDRLDVDYDTGGAWGGPGGWSEYGGANAYEPEVTTRTPYGEVIVKVFNVDPFYREQTKLRENMYDWFVGNVGPSGKEDGLKWDLEDVPGAEDTFRIFWAEDESWRPEEPDYEPDDYDRW